MIPTSPETATTRRQILRTGAIGAAAAAFLAACGGGGNDAPTGQSGAPVQGTVIPPTIPVEAPSEAEMADQVTAIRTATSLELLVAQTYGTYGPKLSTPELRATAVRFDADHTAAAEEMQTLTSAAARVDEPNAYAQENSIDPVSDLLNNDTAILNLMTSLESTLAATYIDAVATMTTSPLRSTFASYSGAAARRSALLANGGAGADPTSALYPPTDLISNAALLPEDPEAAAAN